MNQVKKWADSSGMSHEVQAKATQLVV